MISIYSTLPLNSSHQFPPVALSLSKGTGDFNVTSCLISNSGEVGLYLDSGYSRRYLVTGSNFTGTSRPLYIQGTSQTGSDIKITLNTFSKNSCFSSNCKSLEIDLYRSLTFVGNVLELNTASQILSVFSRHSYGYGIVPNHLVSGNIFRSNNVPASSSGSATVFAMRGNVASNWTVQGNEFNNPISLFEMSSSGFSSPISQLVTINASNNFFGFVSNNDLSASLIDTRLYDDDEGSYPKIQFEPYLSANSTVVCLGNCTNNGVCVFPGLCVCQEGWSGGGCATPTCGTHDFCNGNGQCSNFEECTCSEGWLGLPCDVANCTLRNNCNSNGFCAVSLCG